MALKMLIDNPDDPSDDDVNENFKADTNDERFKSIISNPKFALDPTHKDFSRMKNSDYLKKNRKVV